jgi:plasmid stabilization system protein ParE
MELKIHQAAGRELHEAARRYDLERPGMALEFLQEVERVLEQILAHPKAGTSIAGGYRRQLLRRYPFSIFYKIVGARIIVFAVAHQRRKPGYWHQRR